MAIGINLEGLGAGRGAAGVCMPTFPSKTAPGVYIGVYISSGPGAAWNQSSRVCMPTFPSKTAPGVYAA